MSGWNRNPPSGGGTFWFYGMGPLGPEVSKVALHEGEPKPVGLWADVIPPPPVTDQDMHVLETMTMWDMGSIREGLDAEPWELDECSGMMVRSFYLGTAMNLTPSGKYYLPYACSNVEVCPECLGKGNVPNAGQDTTITSIAGKLEEELRTYCMETYGPFCDGKWPKALCGVLDKLWQACEDFSGVKVCPKCQGTGSEEAHLDEEWWDIMEKLFEQHGLSIHCSEGCSTDIMVSEYKDCEETEEVVDGSEKTSNDP